ncbi:unnamed protein product [Effrenium voratum]|uniref:Beta-lactamase-related domain-containing protein n=1 Tax=Effrenium voratum TaxID=2562239 RepID=A0AA36MMI3_9DINO|nr:unnamed protein product [Effrenium voratum]CAJ1373048.1 unnamed protein product [Effrenium voratum]CAJ1449251.1 unnamed protein product [Effrenium voratum]
MGVDRAAGAEASGAGSGVLQWAISRAARSFGRYGGVFLQATSTFDDSLLFAGAAGFLTTGSMARVSINDAFEVASVTKMVTATVVLQLVEEGHLQLDQYWASVGNGAVAGNVQEHVPAWPARFSNVTVMQLLQHTSCLPNYWEDGSDFVKAFEAKPDRVWQTWELLSYAAAMQTPCEQRDRGKESAFHYADTNYLLLGLMVEHLTSKPLPAAFRDRVFTPAGMSRQGTYCKFLEGRPQDAPPLAARYMGTMQLTGQKRHSADSFAAGGIVTTAEDLEKFMSALSSGRLFQGGTSTLQKMQSWVPAKRGPGFWYGLGVMKIDLAGFSSPFSPFRPEGYIWGHEGFGGAFAWNWVPTSAPGMVITGTTNNEQRSYMDLVLAVLQSTQARGSLRGTGVQP